MNILLTVKNLKHFLNALFILFITQGSVTAAEQWQAPFFQDHKLVGKAWDTHKNAWLPTNQFKFELAQYDYILLGETHNNPDHHRLQAEAINSLVDLGLKPVVVMEMLSQHAWQDQPKIWGKASELQELAGMLNDGWPWELYTPILQSVAQHQLKLFAGNISSAELRRWSNEQSANNKADLLREYAYTEANYEILKTNIIDSHCGHADEKFVNIMSRAQMHRDHIMAKALMEKDLPVVFIAGSGHVRNDYAVPMQLRNKFNQNSYLSVAFVSVQEGENDPQYYLQDVPALYDILYFTPNHTNEDPCVQFSEQLQNLQQQTP